MRKLIIICVVAGLILVASNVAQASVTGWISPTASSAIGLGFNLPGNAYADGGTYAGGYAEAWPYGNANKEQYYGYDFSVSSGATINGIEVRMDAWRNSLATNGSMAVELSWNGGANWTTTGYSTGTLYQGEYTYYKGGASDTWGHTWTADEINTNFRVRIIDSASGGTNGRVYLDWVPVEVTYTITAPAVVPAPSAVVLGGIGLGFVGGWLRLRRQNL